MEHIIDRNSDIVFITETWMTSEKDDLTAKMKEYGYIFRHKIRSERDKETGGGVGILIKPSISHKQVPCRQYSSFEHVVVKLSMNKETLILICIYRLSYISTVIFLEEFMNLLESFIAKGNNFIIGGDINLHLETDESYAKKFKEILHILHLSQHVVGPTHRLGHTLDAVITNSDSIVDNMVITEFDLSDHFLIDFNLNTEVEHKEYKTIVYRKLKAVNKEAFCKSIINNRVDISNAGTLRDKVTIYNQVMKELVNKHAPVKTKTIKVVKKAPWFDKEYADLRKRRRNAEKTFRKTALEIDEKEFIRLRKKTTELASRKKRDFISDKLNKNASTKELFSTVNVLLDSGKEYVLPTADTDKEIANQFIDYFVEKIKKIRSSLCSSSSNTHTSNFSGDTLAQFKPATSDEVLKIVMSFGVKCSPEDPVPVYLLKENLPTFIPIWLEIVNMSLESGSMDCLKDAILIPLIKQLDATTDTENFKNYRPVSNLVFISKLIERIVSDRLESHMIANNLHLEYQYGYKKDHSTESLLLKLVNDLFEIFDKQLPAVLLLLDLSAAFDTVDQKKLLNQLKNDIGIVGMAHKWFESFLVNRSQKVKIGACFSDSTSLDFGVPQGTVLGPRLFNIYLRPLYKYIESINVKIFGYSDDHQTIKAFLPSLQHQALIKDIKHCLEHISRWMSESFLCINQSKTKILVMASPAVQNSIDIRGTFVNNQCIRFVDSAKNLGVLLDKELSFTRQINNIVRNCYFTIKKLSRLKSILTSDQLCTLVCSLVFSQLDYCNSLYYGINAVSLKKLQSVQNCAARLVMKSGIGYRITDQLFVKLHWLKIRERVYFKILLFVHKCLLNKAPTSLCNLISYSASERTMQLNETQTVTKYGDRAFSHCGPKLWNIIPQSVRDESNTNLFKRKLKSYLMINGEQFYLKIIEC